MINKELILELYPDAEMIFWDGFDEAILGVCSHTQKVVYSKAECIKILMQDMSEEDAMEYFSYNIDCAYVGEMTPIICIDAL